MKILINKILIPRLFHKTEAFKVMDNYQFEGYEQDSEALAAPNSDVPLTLAMDIARTADRVQGYAYWVEVPNANLGDDLPAGLSYEKYFDDQEPPVEQTRTWADLEEYGANQAATATMRYWQVSNNGDFLFDDVEIIQEAGFDVYSQADLGIKVNTEYSDTGDPEYVILETIEYIDQNWSFAGYFDFMEAWLRMQELYEAKGGSDLARWNACTTAEQIVLIRWNQVGLNRAATIVPPSWSEGKSLTRLNREYQEFETNATDALKIRATKYYQYLQLALSGSGRTKFESDWVWDNIHEYTGRHLRFYELNDTNKLIDWHDTVLTTYVDADFVGTTLTAANFQNTLRKVLADKSYLI